VFWTRGDCWLVDVVLKYKLCFVKHSSQVSVRLISDTDRDNKVIRNGGVYMLHSQ
jgi:hypothetical protein